MSAALLTQARQAGLIVTLSTERGLACTGEEQTIALWLERLKAAREGIIAELEREQAPDLLSKEEAAILTAWLLRGGDTAAGAEEVVDCCRHDSQAREFFLRAMTCQ